MDSVINPSLKELTSMAINQKLILQGVGWDFYEQILSEYEDSNALHFAYDDGILEVEVPLLKHERPNRILQDLVTTICLELDLDFLNAGSTTFRQEKKTKGCEPDTAFYLSNANSVRNLNEIDLTLDPPPDLAIEIDITSPSLDKMPIYAALGIPEVWLYKGQSIEFHQLIGRHYRKVENSISLPILTTERATAFLESGLTSKPKDWFQEIRDWVNANK